MAYWFSLVVDTDKNWVCDNPTSTLNIDGFRPLMVRSLDTRYDLSQQELWRRTDVARINLQISSEGYETIVSATNAAERLCNILVLASGHGTPLDPGFTQLLRGGTPWTIGQGDFRRPSGGYSGGGITRNITSIGDLIERYGEYPECTVEQIRACANVCNATLPTGIRTSLDYGYSLFMARVSALEALAPDINKNERIRTFLDEAICTLDSKEYLNADDKLELKRALGNAKKESISAKCKAFILEHENTPNLGDAPQGSEQYGLPADQRFRLMYDMRSMYTHGAKGPEEGVESLENHDTARQCGLDAEDMVKLYLRPPE